MPLRPAVFLDRDDTILDTTAATAHTPHPGDLIDPALVHLLPGAAHAIRRLNDARLPVIVISNQGAIARGTPLPLPEGGGRGVGEFFSHDGGNEGADSITPFHLHHNLTSPPPHLPTSPSRTTRPCTLADIELVNNQMRALLLESAGARLDAIYTCPYHPKGSVPPYNVEHPWRKPQPGMLLAAALDLGLDLPNSWMIGDAQRDIDAAIAAGIPREHSLLIGPLQNGLRSLADAADLILAARSTQ